MHDFGEILLPFITPFDESGEVNYAEYEKLLRYAIDRNFVDTIVVSGTTGEFNTLSFDERVKLFKVAVKVANGKYPVLAGTGTTSAWETIALTNEATKAGATAVMIVGPYYCKPTQNGIYDYYIEVLNHTTADIIVYNIPIFTGVNIEPETLGRLAGASKRFIGVKDESGINPVQVLAYRFATREASPDFLIFNGDDIMLLSTLALGAQGIVSGGSLLLGDKVRKVFECYESGKPHEALEHYKTVYRLCTMFGTGGRIHPNPMLRAAVEKVTGFKIGPARLPLDRPSGEEKEMLFKLLGEIGLI